MIDGYIKWLQTALGNDYLVVNEEKIDYDTTNNNQNIMILSEYQGINYRSCIMFTYQAMVLTNDVDRTMKQLQEFTWIHNDERLSTNEFPYVRNLMQQPVNVSNFQQANENYVGTITISITLIAAISLNEIKQVKIDNEVIDPTQITISYQAVTDNNRVNGEELNSTDINEASLNLQIIYPVDFTTFFRKARAIMFGKARKNETFEVEITYADGFVYADNFKLLANTHSGERSSVATQSVTLIK